MCLSLPLLLPSHLPQAQQPAESSLETDDQSAVREVKLAYENVKVVDCLDLTSEGSAAWEAALKRYAIAAIQRTQYICVYT